MRCLKLGVAIVAVALVVAPAQPAGAIEVIDPSNLAQNILQVTHMVEQLRNQVRQIDQAAAMLRTNPLQLSPELSRSIGEARALFQDVQGLAFEARALGAQLHDLYPETWQDYDLKRVLAQSDVWMRESRQSITRAMDAEAGAAERLADTQTRVDRALASSGAAEGQTGAIQAGNQLLGIEASQLSEIHALLIAESRALDTERMERLAREARATEIQRRAFPAGRPADLPPAGTAF